MGWWKQPRPVKVEKGGSRLTASWLRFYAVKATNALADELTKSSPAINNFGLLAEVQFQQAHTFITRLMADEEERHQWVTWLQTGPLSTSLGGGRALSTAQTRFQATMRMVSQTRFGA